MTETPPPRRLAHALPPSRLPAWAAVLLMIAILGAGFTLRVWNINFDQGIGSHPDERSTACFYATTIRLPESWDQFWDPHQSPLNPLWDIGRQERRGFTYGHLPLYLGVATGELMHDAAPLAERLGLPAETVAIMARAHESCDAIAVAGRLLIALFDTITILLLYFLGRRLYGRSGGVLAAALYAFTAQAIQLSHFFAMDPASTTFTVMAVWGSVIMAQDRSWRGVWIAGFGAGLAIASKFSALPILAGPVVAGLLILYRENRHARANGERPDGRAQLVALAGALVALILAGITFFVTSPYAILDAENFVQATLVEQGAMVRGVADFPFTRQYRNTTPYLYFIEQQVVWGMGLPLGIVALLGAGWGLLRLGQSLWRGLRGRSIDATRAGEIILWAWMIPYFGLTGAFLAKFNRYMSPVLPFVLVLTAGFLLWLWRRSGWPRVVGGILGTVALTGAVLWSLAYVNGVYGREHTWLTASRWIYENAPRGSIILHEAWDDALPKAIPGEPGMDMGSTELYNLEWGPYEEDTAEKFEILKERLRTADFVAYSSKRIYDSVDELPRRYPMTNLYYDAMWDGRLGFELAAEFTSPPQLFGYTFDDRHADESWSLYDHPQVTVFRKVRDLTDAEFDALFGTIWEQAVPYDRGPDSPLSPLLSLIGLGSSQESANRGLINRVIGALTGEEAPREPVDPASLLLDTPLRELPVVDNYRWNTRASADPVLAALTWWGVLTLLGWLAWPLAFGLFRPLRDRGYIFSRALGWLLPAWLLWLLASLRVLQFTVVNAWLMVGVLGGAGVVLGIVHARALGRFLRERWPTIVAGELVFGAAYLGFIGIRLLNPDLWQPWYGGEKFMELAFVNGILRSPYFPPVDPHFAGGFINYYYFGLYLVTYLVKLTGIAMEVAFNLAIPTLFALTAVMAYGLALSSSRERRLSSSVPGAPATDAPEPETATRTPGRGYISALLAPLFVAIIGNLDGFAQILRKLADISASQFQSALPGLQTTVRAADGFSQVLRGSAPWPNYSFWEPSRVLPATINEFPWWSFLFADLHPHLIGIVFSLLFLALALTLLRSGALEWRRERVYALALLLSFGLLLGTLASVNLWELPTYFGLGVLALVVMQFMGRGRVRWGATLGLSAAFGLLALLFYAPFFANYANVGAGGVGLVRQGDSLGLWLLIWGFLGFVIVSWLWWTAARPARPVLGSHYGARVRAVTHPSGIERAVSLGLRQFDRLPRQVYLGRVLDLRPSLSYLLLIGLIPAALIGSGIALWAGRGVLALCLPPLALGFLLLWRRGRAADSGTQFALLLATTGLALLAGTQIVYLKDFLGGGDYYRMNTLFKFFTQVWVLFGVAAAIGLPRLWRGWVRRGRAALPLRVVWAVAFALLLIASLTYTFVGTPARLRERMVGWQPPIGTLDGLDYMREGSYTWPDGSNTIELRYDWEAIHWILDNVRGNATVMETSETDYYRAGSSRIASLTGLSGIRGFHAGEQRPGEQTGPRDGLHREFWSTTDPARMRQLIDELAVDYIYVGQLERYLHEGAADRLATLADEGLLDVVFENERTTLYQVNQDDSPTG